MNRDDHEAPASVPAEPHAPHAGGDVYPKPAYAWYMVALLLVVYTFSFIDRQILSLLGPAIKADFGISDTRFGLLTGYAFALFYTGFGLFCARIADSRSRRGLIAVGLTLWSLMTAASGFARGYWQLFAFRIGVGVGEATLAPAAGSLIADSFRKERLATALSVYAMAVPMGAALAFIIGGAVIEFADRLPDIALPGRPPLSDWQKSFLIVGLPGLILTVLVMMLKEPSRKGTSGSARAVPLGEVVTFMKGRWKAYTGICMGVAATAALGYGTVNFLTFFFLRVHDVPPAEMAATFGVIALVSGPIGLLLGGWAADQWLAKGRKDAHIRALMLAPIGYFLPFIVTTLSDNLTLVWAGLAVTNMFINLPTGVAYAGLQLITPNQMRGQAVALFVLTTNLFGYGLGPLLVGYFTDSVFQDPKAINYSLLLLSLITTPFALGLLLWSRKAYAKAFAEEEARLNSSSA